MLLLLSETEFANAAIDSCAKTKFELLPLLPFSIFVLNIVPNNEITNVKTKRDDEKIITFLLLFIKGY